MVRRAIPALPRRSGGDVGQVLLELENLHIARDVPGQRRVLAVRGLTLQVRAGEIVGLIVPPSLFLTAVHGR